MPRFGLNFTFMIASTQTRLRACEDSSKHSLVVNSVSTAISFIQMGMSLHFRFCGSCAKRKVK